VIVLLIQAVVLTLWHTLVTYDAGPGKSGKRVYSHFRRWLTTLDEEFSEHIPKENT